MSFVILTAMSLASLVLVWLERRRGSHVLLVLSVTLLITVGCGLVPNALLIGLQAGYSAEVGDTWPARTAIVLLGAGTESVPIERRVEPGEFGYARIVKAAELYRTCRQREGRCVVLVSGGDASGNGVSEAAAYGDVLRRLGVAPEDLALEHHSMNTWQNAQFCAQWLALHPQDQTLLVSSGVHLRRSVTYFTHFGVHPRPVSADYAHVTWSALPLSINFLLADIALHEYSGILRYHVYQALGWNVAAARPGAV